MVAGPRLGRVAAAVQKGRSSGGGAAGDGRGRRREGVGRPRGVVEVEQSTSRVGSWIGDWVDLRRVSASGARDAAILLSSPQLHLLHLC